MRILKRTWVRNLVFLLSIAAIGSAASVAQAGGQGLEAGHSPGELIIRLEVGVTPADVAAIGKALAESPGSASRILFSNLPIRGELPPRLAARLAAGTPGGVERVNNALDRLRDVFVISLGSDEAADKLLNELTGDSGVIYAEPNRIVEVEHVPDDPFYSSSGSWGQSYADLWGLHIVSAEQAWDLSTGAGVVVGVSDTGVDVNHPEIAARIWALPGEDLNGNGVVDGFPLDCSIQPPPPPDGDFNCIDDDGNGYVDDVRGWDFFESDNDPEDTHGHGTHVSGTIAAEGNNGIGVIGLAYDARIMPIRGFGPSGSSTHDMLSQTVTYAALAGVDVLNMSWGGTGGSTLLEDAIRTAYEAGVLLVAAAGNNSSDVGNYYPANYDGVMAIAASTHTDGDADFSNHGQGISVSAPGGDSADPEDEEATYNNILSLKSADAETMDWPERIVDEIYYRARGTSMATPHVVGLGALIRSYHPEISAGLVQVIIEASADDIGAPGFDPLTGHGRINARAALELSDLASTRAELVASLGSGGQTAAQDGPFTLTVKVENVGTVDARDVSIELHDGTPGIGSHVLDHWTVKQIRPGMSYSSQRIYSLRDPGAHELVLVVDPRESIPETGGANNRATTDLHVMKYQWVESLISEIAGVNQSYPTISGDFITWTDRRDGEGHIYLYDIAAGTEKKLTKVGSSKSYPVISDRRVVWLDRRDGRPDLYSIDLDSGDETILTTEGTSRSAPAIDGEMVTWSDSRYSNFDIFAFDLAGGGESVVADDPSPEYAPAISGQKITWYSTLDGISDLHLYDLTNGDDEIVATSKESIFSPDISPTGIAYAQGSVASGKEFNFEIYLRRTGHSENQRLTTGGGLKYSVSISRSTITWIEGFGISSLVAYDTGVGARPLIVSGILSGRPDVDKGRIVWSECRVPGVVGCPSHIYMAETDPLARTPRDLSARSAGSTAIALDWSDNTESDFWIYRIYRRGVTTGPYTLIATTSDSSFTDTQLKTGKRYYYRVTAVDQHDGEGTFSAEDSAVPRRPCRDCPNIQESPGGDER